MSYQAAVYRLLSLQHVTRAECNELLAREAVGKDFLESLNLFDDLEGKDDKSLIERELRSQVARLAIEAFRREEISRGRLLDLGKLLGIPGAKLVGWAEATRGKRSAVKALSGPWIAVAQIFSRRSNRLISLNIEIIVVLQSKHSIA